MTGILVLLLLAFREPPPGAEERILRLLGQTDAEVLDEEVLERFAALRRQPLRVNFSSRSRLLASGLFSPYQVASLLDYRARCGDIVSLAELSVVDGFDPQTVQVLAPYLSVELPRRPRGEPSGFQSASGSGWRHAWEGRCGVRWRDRAADGQWATRYRISAGDRAEAAVALRSPYGGGMTGTFFAACYGRRHLGKLIVGDFHARFGQGLAAWSGFSLGGVALPASFQRRSGGLSPSASYSDAGHRGVAADFDFGRWCLSTAVSLPGLRPWMEAGKPFSPSVRPLVNLTRYGRNGQVGMTATGTFPPAGMPASLRISLDGRWCLGGVDFFGEAAFDPLVGKGAAIAGTLFPVGAVRMAVAARWYPAGFVAEGALHSASKATDEAALSWAGEWKDWSVSLDGAWHPAAGRRQLKGLAAGAVHFGDWTWKFRLSERLRTYAPANRTDLRSDLSWSRGRWLATARLNAVLSHGCGLLGYLEGGFRAEGGTLYLRGTFFRADHWDDRIYCYERDAPGNFTVPACYGRGYLLSLVGSLKGRWGGVRVKTYLRASWQAYPWMDVPKPSVGTLRLQLMLDF